MRKHYEITKEMYNEIWNYTDDVAKIIRIIIDTEPRLYFNYDNIKFDNSLFKFQLFPNSNIRNIIDVHYKSKSLRAFTNINYSDTNDIENIRLNIFIPAERDDDFILEIRYLIYNEIYEIIEKCFKKKQSEFVSC